MKFEAIILNVQVFFMQNFRSTIFCVFVLEHSVTSQVNFFTLQFFILNDFNCSHYEMKFVANIKVSVSG